MEQCVDVFEICRNVTSAGRMPQPFTNLKKHRDLRVRGTVDHSYQGNSLQPVGRIIKISQLFYRVVLYENAAPGMAYDHSLALQDVGRFSDRCAACAELRAELDLVQPLTRLNPTIENFLSYRSGYLLRQSAPCDFEHIRSKAPVC